jgi:hypothetical protein
VYLGNLVLSIWAMIPNENDRLPDSDDEEEPTDKLPTRNWEMQSIASPGLPQNTPFTPRTQAFHTLERKLPLRQ